MTIIKAILNYDRIFGVRFSNLLGCFPGLLPLQDCCTRPKCQTSAIQCRKYGAAFSDDDVESLEGKSTEQSRDCCARFSNPFFLRLRAHANCLKNLYVAAHTNGILGITYVRLESF